MKKYLFQFKYSYALAQLVGWLGYIAFTFILNELAGNDISPRLFVGLSVVFFSGLLMSHLYRAIILKLNWLSMNILKVIPRLSIGSLLFGLLFELVYVQINTILNGNASDYQFGFDIKETFGWIFNFILWSTIYFAYHYFRNYKNEEIKNLKLEASRTEIELSNLKSQLNPHFIFNAMNSIRALIDEDPKKAKNAVTQLSNVLRISLQSGKRKLVSFSEELNLVKNYLAIEKARYEERLNIEYQIDESTLQTLVPPLMLQTLCENAIKHGIAKKAKGGKLLIKCAIINEQFTMEVQNTGKLNEAKISNASGIGIENTMERLKLLYGNNAVFKIFQLTDQLVCSKVILKT